MAASYNELFGLGSHSPDAALEIHWLCQDDAASTDVIDTSGNGRHGTLSGGDDTEDVSELGPNAWLPKAIGFANNISRLVTAAYARSVWPITIGAFYLCDGTGTHAAVCYANSASNSQYFSLYGRGSSGFDVILHRMSVSVSAAGTIAAGSWRHSVGVFAGNTDKRLYIHGELDATLATSSLPSDFSQFALGGINRTTPLHPLSGAVAGAALFSRELTVGEIQQWNAGPEPINVTPPGSPSGTTTVGETLTASAGTWDDADNGSLVYSYQWYRADNDEGAGEVAIDGATSATYTLVAGDAAKFIRHSVRAANDGGYDAAEDQTSAYVEITGDETPDAPILDAGTWWDIDCGSLTDIDCGVFENLIPTAQISSVTLSNDTSRSYDVITQTPAEIITATKTPKKATIAGTVSARAIVQAVLDGTPRFRSFDIDDAFSFDVPLPSVASSSTSTLSLHPGGASRSIAYGADATIATATKLKPGNASQYFRAAIDGRLAVAAAPATSLKQWSVRDHSNGIYTPNPDFWARDLDLTGYSVVMHDGTEFNPKLVATLITPRIAVNAAHRSLRGLTTYRFVDRDGSIVEREIVSTTSNSDVRLILLDDDVPNCTPAQLLPANWATYIPNSGAGLPMLGFDQISNGAVRDLVTIKNFVGRVQAEQSSDPIRSSFFVELFGDSGLPLFLIGPSGVILLGTWWTKEPDAAASLVNHIEWIADNCQSLAGQSPTYLNLSVFS